MDRKRSGNGVPYSHIGGSMQRSASDIDNDTDALTVSNGRRRHRLWTVAAFCTIACFDSAISGIMLSFSSGTILELDKVYRDGDHVRGVQEGSTFASLIGVSQLHCLHGCFFLSHRFRPLPLSFWSPACAAWKFGSAQKKLFACAL